MLCELALRLAVIEVLAPSALAETGPWPTIAGPRVYDSRQEPLDALADDDNRPILIVYTEELTAEPYPSAKSRPDHVTINLVIEAAIAAKGLVPVEKPDGTTGTVGSLEVPISDSEHEALLNLLCATVRRRIEGRTDIDAATQSLRLVAKEIAHLHSVPQRDSSRTVRLAARTMSWRIVVKADDWPVPGFTSSDASGLDRLPEPLRSVANALPDGSNGRAICVSMADLLSPQPTLTRLGTVDLNWKIKPSDISNDAIISIGS